MKYFFILFFFTLLSCGPGKKVFICGDRPCIDKKEFDKYFVENFIIEIQPDKKNKEKTIDLVKLNAFYKEKKNTNKKNSNFANNKLNKKEERAILKAQKVRLKNERKLDKIKRRNKIKEEKTLAKQETLINEKLNEISRLQHQIDSLGIQITELRNQILGTGTDAQALSDMAFAALLG